MRILYLVGFTLLFVGCKSSEAPFSSKDIRSAQNLAGVEFEKERIDQMSGYLARNRAGYDSMRQYQLDYGVMPAVVFDPRPMGFQMPVKEESPSWEPVETSRPDNLEEAAFYSIRQLAYLLQNREVTSVELTEMFIDRIKRYNSCLLYTSPSPRDA